MHKLKNIHLNTQEVQTQKSLQMCNNAVLITT